jgi:hypothetical protein
MAYRFVLQSSCGEQGLIGRFRIAVRDGRVSDAVGLDDSTRSVDDESCFVISGYVVDRAPSATG